MTSPNADPVKVYKIEWLKLFPVLHLVKAARLGIRIRVVVPSLLMMLCLALGPTFEQADTGGLRSSRLSNGQPSLRLVETLPLAVFLPQSVFNIVENASSIVLGSGGNFRNLCLALAWNMLLVGVLGLAVARATATDFCASIRTGALHSLKYSLNHLLPLAAASALVVVVAGLFLGPLSLASWAAESVPWVKQLVMLAWLPLAGLSALGVLASIVCFCGWLFAIAAIGVDGCDGADALSRGINYTLSHKLTTFCYLVVAAIVSVLCRWFVSRILTAALLRLSASFPWIGGSQSPTDEPNAGYAFAMQLLDQLPAAVHWGAFMCGVTIVYVLLRQREDAVNLDQFDDSVTAKSSGH